jgi:hypothetical protein
VHVVVPVEPTKWIEHAIRVVDKSILNLGGITIIHHPLGHGIPLGLSI